MSRHNEKTLEDVLAILQRHNKPVSAYDVLDEMSVAKKRTLSPPTVYRALAALKDRGQVHRVESLNAYVACRHGRHEQPCIMSICEDCGSVEECIAPDVLRDLASIAAQSGFTPVRHMIEIHGVCASCREGSMAG